MANIFIYFLFLWSILIEEWNMHKQLSHHTNVSYKFYILVI